MLDEKTIKNLLQFSLIIALLVGAYAVYSYTATYADSMNSRSFSITGEAKMSVKPDIAEISFGVNSEGGKDIAKLQADNTEKMNKIIDFIKKEKIAEDDIQTTVYSIEPRYQYSYCVGLPACPPAEIVGYSVRQSVKIKIRDFSIISKVLAGLVAGGANNISQLSFTVDDPDSLLGQVRGEAVKRAQAKAEILAKTAGFKLGELISIDDNYGLYSDVAYGVGGGPEAISLNKAAVAPTIEAGSKELSASVMLRYAIK